MKALVLAAGRGRRLGGEETPKCLLDVEGRSLLARMLDGLRRAGVTLVTLVVGYEAGQVRAAAEALAAAGQAPPVRFIENPEWRRGSVVSLHSARGLAGEDDLLVMDADVLFPQALLERLVRSPRPNAFLLDRRARATGEEMMLCARDGRVHRIARRVDPAGYDTLGEGVGFLKLRRADQAALWDEVAALVEAGQLDRDYEDAIDRFLGRVEVGYEEVGELPWTEVDFPEDLARARELGRALES